VRRAAPLAVEAVQASEITRQFSGMLPVHTPGPGFTELNAALARFVAESGITVGLLTLFCRHTSASLMIGENADPDVRADLATALDGLAPRGAQYRHGCEGPDDMPAHIRTMLTATSLAIPVTEGSMALGTWQGVFLLEHRDRPHLREIAIHLAGR
jgi:secondary thiamine-phosphate synthase enzyme